MGKFESLTRYLILFENGAVGTWVIDKENDGTPEHPFKMPYVNYSEIVHKFIGDIYDFYNKNEDLDMGHYGEILEQNGLKWDSESMINADVSGLDERCVMALIMGAVRAERFCDGALLNFFNNGSIRKWLERLKKIDEGEI